MWEGKGAEPQTAASWLSHTATSQHGTAETEHSQPKPDLLKVRTSMQETEHISCNSLLAGSATFTYCVLEDVGLGSFSCTRPCKG